MKAHKEHTKHFEELTYKEQANSINSEMTYLPRAVKAHLRKAENEGRNIKLVHRKCVNQLRRLLQRITRLRMI